MELKAKKTEPNKNDPAIKYGERLRSLLESGEGLRGICVGSWQKNYFSTKVVAIGVTERRVIVQLLDRRGNFRDEAPVSVYAEDLTKRKVGAGAGFSDAGAGLLNASTMTVKLATRSGEKLKLQLTNGEGILGAFSGPSQKSGAEALVEFVEGRSASSAV